MKTLSYVCCLLLGLMVLMAPYSGCTPQDGEDPDNGGVDPGNGGVDPGNGDDDPPAEALIKTQIELENAAYLASGKLAVGEDLIVWGVPDNSVYYLVPSTADEDTEAGIMIPNSDLLFGFRDFAVAGKKVVLVRSTNEVAVFNTITGGEPVDIPGGDITLHALPVDANAPGHMMADGHLVATINNVNRVADGNAIKVIDLNGSTPVIISCAQPTDFQATFRQVAVDAATRQVVAYAKSPGEKIYLWDLDNPTAQPAEFDLFGNAMPSSQVQLQFDGNYVLYRQGFTDATALLDVNDGTITTFTRRSDFAVNSPVALKGGKFGFFVAQENADSISGQTFVYRSAIGAVGDVPNATLASQTTMIPADDCVQKDVPFGYGNTMTITPDGERWFLSGSGYIVDNMEYLQMKEGNGDWELFPDEETLSGWLMASDVVSSNDTVAFRALRQNITSGCITSGVDQWVLGFIVLDRLD